MATARTLSKTGRTVGSEGVRILRSEAASTIADLDLLQAIVGLWGRAVSGPNRALPGLGDISAWASHQCLSVQSPVVDYRTPGPTSYAWTE